jgi:hypothetical protein
VTFKNQTIVAYYFFVFVDHILEKKWVKESSVFNRYVRKQLTTKAKETPQEAVNPGNNPHSTNPVRSSSTHDSRMSLAFPGILPEEMLAHLKFSFKSMWSKIKNLS